MLSFLATLWPRLGVYACVAALLLGIGAGTCWYIVADTIAGLKAQVHTLSADLKRAAETRMLDKQVSEQRATVRQQRATETRGSAAKDAAALAKVKPWADTPVPQEVLDALQ
jgi:hypothetical protein